MKKFSSTMKANSRRTSQTKRRVGIILISTALLLLVLFVLPRAAYVIAGTVIAPVNALKSWVQNSSASLPTYLRDRAEVAAHIRDLEQQLADRGGDRYTSEMLVKENQQLRALLGSGNERRILAGIIGRPSVLPYDLLMLDRGSAEGIAEGAPVYIGERTVIGFVQSVSEHTALVTLVTTPGYHSTVYVFGPDVYATAIGQGGGQLRIGIPQGIAIQEGDLVILPSVDSGVYGSVSHVESVPAQPEQYAYVAPKLSLASLRLVSVGANPLTNIDFDTAAANVAAAHAELFTVAVPAEHATATASSSAMASSTNQHDE